MHSFLRWYRHLCAPPSGPPWVARDAKWRSVNAFQSVILTLSMKTVNLVTGNVNTVMQIPKTTVSFATTKPWPTTTVPAAVSAQSVTSSSTTCAPPATQTAQSATTTPTSPVMPAQPTPTYSAVPFVSVSVPTPILLMISKECVILTSMHCSPPSTTLPLSTTTVGRVSFGRGGRHRANHAMPRAWHAHSIRWVGARRVRLELSWQTTISVWIV